LIMVARLPPHNEHLITVDKACAEQGFYTIAVEDLEETHRADHDPEAVEKVFADLEAEAATIIRAVLEGGFPLSPELRFKLALFAALQVTRGWRFRRDMNDLGTFAMRQYVEALPSDRFRDWLRGQGMPSNDASVAAFRERVVGPDGPQLVMSQPFAVQESLRMALEEISTHLFLRTWRLLRFSDDLLLTSDNPVGIWSLVPPGMGWPGGQDFSVGVANAQMICLPLNRRTALAMIPRAGPDRMTDSGPTRARQINMAVIHDAERWIYHHPGDRLLDGIAIPQHAVFTDETVAVREEAGGIRRELHRVIRRMPQEPAV
jgi:hypothetical protein